jgi:DNA polymerase-3 subunit beta
MKFICSKQDLLSAVNIVSKAVSSKSTTAILECILIRASENQIILTGNDTELGIETRIRGNVEENGVIALPAKFFYEVVRKLPDNDVTIESDEKYTTTITCEKATFQIPGRSGDDFTRLPVIEKEKFITISELTLREMIQHTIFSISDNESNKIMTGELFEINGEEFRIVSLDGHRISIRKILLKAAYDPIKVIVPGKALSDLSKILFGGIEDEVFIYFTANHIVFEFGDTVVVSRLIEGEYFRINQMLSLDYSTKVIIRKRELLNCVDRAILMIRENDKKPLILTITNGEMKLRIRSEVGSMNESIDIVKEGQDITIAFNPKFIMDVLRNIEDEEITLYLASPKVPCSIRDTDNNYIYIILPVNFNAET